MKVSVMAARDHEAQERMVAAIEALSARYDVGVPEKVRSQRGSPEVQAMMQREGMAAFLEGLVAAADEEE